MKNPGDRPNRHNGGPRQTARNLAPSPTKTILQVRAQADSLNGRAGSADDHVLVRQMIEPPQTRARKMRAVTDKVAAQAKIIASPPGKRAKSFKDGKSRSMVKTVRRLERSWPASRNAKRAMRFQRTDY
ncbi:unnamed protein product [Trichogramma brassicae]|uniref:Uncharacterized protein n=1 Tax=Trichogramma brassicae TaxID=86971 RepID=A0A6H5I9U2_9HYME|nr:unnamed protein product [Trichogramma brassicae]